MAASDALLNRIKDRSARVGIIGLGYVGLPLAVEFAKAGFRVTGIDLDSEKVKMVNRGASYIQDSSSTELAGLVSTGMLEATTDFSVLESLDTVSICVPTPLGKTKDPDISYIVAATKEVASRLHREQLVVLESTTYPGTTDEVILPELEKRGFKVGEDFFLAFSPERVDPGNPKFNTKNTPKIIGGITTRCTEAAKALYEQAVDTVIMVSSTKAAEMVKILENTYRAVNIALVNEVAIMCDRLQLDVWEVIDAASTKPFGFMAFYPGPGLGGHCIPIDPHYLSWKLKMLDYKARFIDLASEINREMPLYVLGKITDALNDRGLSVKGAKILVLGVTYKRDVGDLRESPSLDIIRLLARKGAEVRFHDPYVSSLAGFDGVRFVELNEKHLEKSDCVVIVTDHSTFDYETIVAKAPLIVDTRNATRNVRKHRGKIVKL